MPANQALRAEPAKRPARKPRSAASSATPRNLASRSLHLRHWPFMLWKRWWLPLVCASLAFSQDGGLPAKETLYYNIEWRLITAGKAKVEWMAAPQRSHWQINLHVESVGMVSKLFKVEDDYNAILNAALCTQLAQM